MSGTLRQLLSLALTAAVCSPVGAQTQWVRRSPSGPSTAYLTDVAYGAGQFVATGNDGVVLTSVNGATWARSLSGVSFDLEDVVWTGSRFIAAGDDFDDSIATSSDGITWSAQAIGTSASIVSVCYANGLVLAFRDDDTVMTSPTGTTWTAHPCSTGGGLVYSATWTGSQFVAVGYGGRTVTSPDGVTWTLRVGGSLNANTLMSVAANDSIIVAVGAYGRITTSRNGTSWTDRTSGTGEWLERVVWTGTKFVAVGGATVVATSSNGVTWSSAELGAGILYFNGLAWNGSRLVAVGSEGFIAASDDNGATWVDAYSVLPGNRLLDAFFASPLVYVLGEYGFALSTLDDRSWTRMYAPTRGAIAAAAQTAYRTTAVGDSGVILYPASGQWYRDASPTRQNLRGIGAADSQRVAVGDSGTIVTSKVGSMWTLRTSGTTRTLRSACVAGSMFVVVGDSGTILTSTDGAVWAPESSGTTRQLLRVIHTGSQWVAVGDSGTVLTSPNASDWTRRTSGTTRALRGITYHDGLAVAVGDRGAVLMSLDGIDWDTAHSGVTDNLRGVTWSDRTSEYIAVGDSGTIITAAASVAVTPDLGAGSAAADLQLRVHVCGPAGLLRIVWPAIPAGAVADCAVYAVSGVTVKRARQSSRTGALVLETSSLAPGRYLLRVACGGRAATRAFVKR